MKTTTRITGLRTGLLALTAVLTGTLWVPGGARLAAQTPTGAGCELCHGELELLRQHTPSLTEARALLTTATEIEASAHKGISCTECHTGFGPFPHTSTPEALTRSCQSCHDEVATSWRGGMHGPNGDEDRPGAECSECHGLHAVAPRERVMVGAPDGAAMNDRCTTCHETRVLPSTDLHADTTLCSDCHAPHATRAVDDAESRVAPGNQGTTCGACHEDNATAWLSDVHGMAVMGHPLPRAEGESEATEGHGHDGPGLDEMDPASCTSCHGGHGIQGVEEDRLLGNSTAVCEGCHVAYANTYLNSYHGQATTLGSRAAADCAACHSGHEVYPTRDARSWVGEEKLLATCQTCHPAAGPRFAAFAPHVDHHDREKYPQVYWTFRLMTGLLIGVFAVFGLHTLLWLARLTLLDHPARRDPKNGRPS